MSSLKIIQEIANETKIALVGVSRSKTKFGSMAFKELKKRGYSIFPVNSNIEDFEGEKCYQNISEIPNDVKVAIIVTKPEKTIEIIKDSQTKGIKYLWIQKGAENKEIIEYCNQNNITAVFNECVLMFLKPDSIHKFHGWLKKIFGKYPK